MPLRSKWSAELALLFGATAALEGAWLTLANILLQWLTSSRTLSLGILAFSLAVVVGMVVGRTLRNASQTTYGVALVGTAIAAGAIGAFVSGSAAPLVDPGVWLMGIAVFRGSVQSDPASGYQSERVFSIGIPALVGFWVLATIAEMSHDAEFTTAAFTASLTFVTAGLLSLGLGRLRDLQVEAIDRNARRRWVGLVLAIVGLVLVIGIPLSAVLGLPVSSAIFGALGPLAPLLDVVFTALAIPLYYVITFLVGLLGTGASPLATAVPVGPLASAAPQPNIPPPQGALPDYTLLVLVSLVVGALILMRVIVLVVGRAKIDEGDEEAVESRASEPIALPSLPRLPRLPRLTWRARRDEPTTAAQAYVMSLEALAGGPNARLARETPREHAVRVQDGDVGRDLGRLATDFQLDQFARRRLTATEVRRAIERWRRIAARQRAKH
jgi:hypothetical protein